MVGGKGLFAWSTLHTVSAWSIFTLPERPQIDNHILCTVIDEMCYIVYGCFHLRQHDVMEMLCMQCCTLYKYMYNMSYTLYIYTYAGI